MSELLAGASAETTLAGILGTALLAFLIALGKGLMVPRSHVTDAQAAADQRATFAEATAEMRIAEVRADRDARIAETADRAAAALADAYSQRDDWREAFRASDARGDVTSAQLSQVVEGQRTVVAFIQSVSRVAGSEQP